MNCLCRTGFHTSTAVGTLIIVDRSVEVIYSYSPVRTFLLAYLTADTAVFAGKFCSLAVIAGGTKNINMLCKWLYTDKTVWTGSCALTAGTA